MLKYWQNKASQKFKFLLLHQNRSSISKRVHRFISLWVTYQKWEVICWWTLFPITHTALEAPPPPSFMTFTPGLEGWRVGRGLLQSCRVMALRKLVGLETLPNCQEHASGGPDGREGCQTFLQRCREDAFQLCQVSEKVEQWWHLSINLLALEKLGVRGKRNISPS